MLQEDIPDAKAEHMSHSEFKDDLVVYWSAEDECFVAHSLRTDQAGYGDRVVDALAEAIGVVESLVRLHLSDPTVQLYCEAPAEIQEIIETAEELPNEIYEIAHKMALGKWPENLPVDLSEDENFEQFVTRKFAVKPVAA